MLFLQLALEHVFRTCKIDNFYPIFGPQNVNLPGSQKMFLSAVIRANIGLFISGEKNLDIVSWCVSTASKIDFFPKT